MKNIKIFSVIFVIVFFTSNSYSQNKNTEFIETSKISSDLIQIIEINLPEDWKIEILKNKLHIERKKKVSAVIITVSMPMFVKPEETAYLFTLKLTNFISSNVFKKINDDNQKLKKEAELLYQESNIYDIPAGRIKAPPWEYKYYPRTSEESKVIERYKYLHSQIQILPDYHHNNQMGEMSEFSCKMLA